MSLPHRLPHCPGPLGRRAFLQIGGLSLGALASGMEPSLAQVLAAETAAGAEREFSVIWLWAAGGPSHLETFDMKPEAPTECRGAFKPIATNVPGIEICELMPNLARRADKFSLIRSLHHNRNEHASGTNRMLSGYASVGLNPADGEFPEIGSIVAQQLEDQVRDIPLFVSSNKLYGGGPAYLGPACTPFMYSGDPAKPNFGAGSLTVTSDATALLRKRLELLQRFDSFRREVDRSQTMTALDKFNARALDMLTSSRTREAFDLSREPDAVRDRYGRTTGGQSLLLARRLVEAGVRFVQISASFPIDKPTSVISPNNWDDHSVNCDIFKAYQARMPTFDVAVPALIDDLYARGLDRKVLFVFAGEFSRTPKVNMRPGAKWPGRDHWSRAISVLISGGGLKMGQVVGATNSHGEEPAERPMNSNCLLATIYRGFGIDTTQVYHDNSGRPLPILTDGQPIAELI
jgi:hypothetical protein